jgi:tetratricopeptide (TPR) repeat protein
MNMHEKAYACFDSARITLESKIHKDPDDPRLYSALGIAYAGLGLKEKAVEAGERAVELMPVSKEAFRGAVRVEDLARIYVMVGEYDAALEQIKLLLRIPSRLSVKLLQLDPDWKPLWNLAEFKKIIETSPPDNSRIK